MLRATCNQPHLHRLIASSLRQLSITAHNFDEKTPDNNNNNNNNPASPEAGHTGEKLKGNLNNLADVLSQEVAKKKAEQQKTAPRKQQQTPQRRPQMKTPAISKGPTVSNLADMLSKESGKPRPPITTSQPPTSTSQSTTPSPPSPPKSQNDMHRVADVLGKKPDQPHDEAKKEQDRRLKEQMDKLADLLGGKTTPSATTTTTPTPSTEQPAATSVTTTASGSPQETLKDNRMEMSRIRQASMKKKERPLSVEEQKSKIRSALPQKPGGRRAGHDPEMHAELTELMKGLFQGLDKVEINNEQFNLRMRDPVNKERLRQIREILQRNPDLGATDQEMAQLVGYLVEEEHEQGQNWHNWKEETQQFINKMIQNDSQWDEKKFKSIFTVPPSKRFFPDYENMKDPPPPAQQPDQDAPEEWVPPGLARPPQNGFEVQMMDSNKRWSFPIDNQVNMKEDVKGESFEDHVFLDHHLADFPQTRPVQEYMELVIAGLQQNPWMSYDKKIRRINWYKKYFSKFGEEALQ